MATEIPGETLEIKQKGRAQKYPWDQWQNGSVWFIESGIDFQSTAEQFMGQIYGRARRAGMRVTVRLEPGALRFQFFPKKASE